MVLYFCIRIGRDWLSSIKQDYFQNLMNMNMKLLSHMSIVYHHYDQIVNHEYVDAPPFLKVIIFQKQQFVMMYKKATQPPTSLNPSTKKFTKQPEKASYGSIDKKNQTGNTQFKSKEQQLLLMVKEYLQMCGYLRAFQTLKNEKPNIRAKVQLNHQQAKTELDKNHIIQLFEKGSRDQFFKQTTKIFHNADQAMKKLQFELNVYFCIYNIHPCLKKQATIDKANTQAFKRYLDTKGSDLSQTSQYLSLFALPFMPKPQEHKALAHVFTREWITKLKNKLVDELTSHLKGSNSFQNNQSRKVSQLQEIYHNSIHSINSSRDQCKENCNHSMQIEHLKKQNNQLRIIIENYRKKFQQFTQSSKLNLLQSNQKWFNFSRQIFLIAKKHIKQDKVKLIDKYNSFFIGNIDEHIQANQISLFDKNSYVNEDLSMTPDLSKQRIALKRQQTMNQNCQIDHVRIRGIFLLGNHHEKQTQICMILKALKKRYTKKKEFTQRRQIMIEYSRADVCGINEENYIIQKKLLFDSGQKVKTLYLKFMEELTTDAFGLKYLTKSKKLVQNLVGILSIEHEDSRFRKIVLGILQRISFSKTPRMLMIKLGIIPIIFNIFKNEGSQISDFTIQFSIATWMNLSLKKQSFPDFEKHKSELISIVMLQMLSPNQNIRDYINGTIFLLLTSREIKNEALKQKMDIFMKQLIESENENVCIQQCTYILDRLTGKEEDNACHNDDSDSQEEEMDPQEFEDDEDVSLSQSSEDTFDEEMEIANGQEFLVKNYALLGPQAMREQLLTKSVLDETSKRLNNMTTSINRSRRLDNIFNGKGNVTVLEPQFDNILNRKK